MTGLTATDILAQAENPAYTRVATARVLLRQDMVAKHRELEAELTAAVARDATTNERDQAPEIARQIEALEAEMETAKVEFRFRAVGKKAWADLLAKHPPLKEHKELRVDHNPETFPIAAIAASCVSPELSEDDVRRLEVAMTDAQFTVLWRGCIDANIGGVESPKSLAAGQILRVNERSGTTAVPAASPEASS